ncbi:MAG TPA: hypothetical protein HA252_05295 [Candidatus Diapherotrites archaeon]|uniref:DNA primase small subunit PriS n=1 Tax=Candidatus Iainarchaeum sp. TaxID=3101447 RepID=A0A7J4JHJ5_9ARCH|nr:hypothetical protein [Candidatus Diapherotrites archaeon]HIH16794.1 hypothetical protein [Candidatus Diapherotrites archaeon]
MEVVGFLRERFRAYYAKTPVAGPPDLAQREFGTGDYGIKINQRHLAFRSREELNRFLREQAPFYISYSNAYYNYPDRRPMEAKKFIKADLVYEFDADDLKTDCKKQHDAWKCGKCGANGPGLLENCTSCGQRVEREEWVCGECLGAVKKQVFRLLDFLENDFGLSAADGMAINSSGGKGYHLHVRSEAVQHLSNPARIELLDYLTAANLDFKALGFYLTEDHRFVCPPRSRGEALGWARRLLDRLAEFLSTADASALSVYGRIGIPTAKKLLEKREKILADLDKGLMHQFPGKQTEQFWGNLLAYAVEGLRLDVDRQTSADISKIVRVPDTLHGSTGLLAKTVALEALPAFDPLKETVVFGGGGETVKVKALKAPRFSLGGEGFGPYSQEVVELPEFAAIYLLARGAAELLPRP